MAGFTDIRLGDFAAIVFDKDGVLADSEGINFVSTVLAFREFGIALPEEARKLIVGRHPDDFLGELAGKYGLSAENLPELSCLKAALYAEEWQAQGAMCAGAGSLLARLNHACLPLGICTNAAAPELSGFIERFDLCNVFSVALSREDVAQPKPAPDIYLAAAKRLGLPAEHLLVVEDSPYGIAAARAAGTQCIAICADGASRPGATTGHNKVASLMELEARLFGDLAE